MLLSTILFAAAALSAQGLEEQEISLSEQTAVLEEDVSAEEWAFLFGDEEEDAQAADDDDDDE